MRVQAPVGTDRHGTDRHGTDRHGTDRHGTDRHGTDRERGSRPVTEGEGWSAPGVPVLVTGIGMLLAAVGLLVLGDVASPGGAGPMTAIVAAILLFIAAALAYGGLQLALQRLREEDVVELDEERKAAMVSNLLVVLCSEQATQQVVNTGSLYQ